MLQSTSMVKSVECFSRTVSPSRKQVFPRITFLMQHITDSYVLFPVTTTHFHVFLGRPLVWCDVTTVTSHTGHSLSAISTSDLLFSNSKECLPGVQGSGKKRTFERLNSGKDQNIRSPRKQNNIDSLQVDVIPCVSNVTDLFLTFIRSLCLTQVIAYPQNGVTVFWSIVARK